MNGVLLGVFPAYAGMSHAGPWGEGAGECFPRLRGDEPLWTEKIQPGLGFSPPTRG